MTGTKGDWRGDTHLLDEGIRMFQADSASFVPNLEHYAATLTTQHARLMRHKEKIQ